MSFEFEDAGLQWTTGRTYPAFPHVYRDVEDLVVSFETDPDSVVQFLPRGVTPAGDPVQCQAKFRWTPFSVHGPYHEAYVSATVTYEGETYRYLLMAYTDNDSPLIAGRELWGTPKKLGTMTRNWSGPEAQAPFTEMMIGTLDRPKGMRLMTLGLSITAQAKLPVAPAMPSLLIRILPDATLTRPEVAQLIRIDGHADIQISANGNPMLFAGNGSLSFDAMSQNDPLYLLAPKRILGASYAKLDFTHGPGKVIHSYV